jgi:hypothetical protein
MPTSAPRTYPYPYAQVMDALPRILPSLNFQVIGQDLAQGTVRVRGAGTIMAAGENLTILVGTNHPQWSVVSVDSGLRLSVLTYARTSTNFNQILDLLATYLDQYYSEWRAPGAAPASAPPPPNPPSYPPPQQQQQQQQQ